MNRRDLVKAALLTAASRARISGANDRLRMGIIGCGGRGRYVANYMLQSPGVEFAALCDVYEPNRAQKAKAVLNPNAAIHGDLRELLDRKDIDAVLIATPDHWHALATVAACRAGKDVYVEKPLTHNIREGRAMIRVARESDRIVQAGTQQRSAPHFAECARIVQSGQLGHVHLVRVWNYTSLYPEGFGKPADTSPPSGLNWDMFLGPAPVHPFNSLRFLQTFRWFWDYAGGLITDFGTHRFDTVHEIMGADRPRTVSAAGGRFAQRDGGEMPDTLQVTYEYPTFVMTYECCTLNSHGVGGRTAGQNYYRARGGDDRANGMAFYGTNGALFADRIGYEIYPEPVDEERGDRPTISGYRMERKVVQAKDAIAAHTRAFVDNVRARKQPEANLETGHRATTIAHLGNIAYKTGLKLRWNAEAEDFDNQPDASALLWREPRKPYDWISVDFHPLPLK